MYSMPQVYSVSMVHNTECFSYNNYIFSELFTANILLQATGFRQPRPQSNMMILAHDIPQSMKESS